jgi:hypothetical protein
MKCTLSVERNLRDSSVAVSKHSLMLQTTPTFQSLRIGKFSFLTEIIQKMLVNFLCMLFLKKAESVLQHQEVLVVSGHTDCVDNAHGVWTITGDDGMRQKLVVHYQTFSTITRKVIVWSGFMLSSATEACHPL